MTRDIAERLRLFPLHDWVRFEGDKHSDMPREERKAWLIAEHPSSGWDTRLDVRRLALTWDQVQQYSPPPNPAKSTDARYRKYAEEHGDESWELDALEPTVLGQLVRDEIDAILVTTAGTRRSSARTPAWPGWRPSRSAGPRSRTSSDDAGRHVEAEIKRAGRDASFRAFSGPRSGRRRRRCAARPPIRCPPQATAPRQPVR